VRQTESKTVPSLSFTPGFPAADIACCGPVVWAYGTTEAAAKQACQSVVNFILDKRQAWQSPIYPAEAAVRYAMKASAGKHKPIVIADTQDNPGAGGNSDSTGMLRALIACNAQNAAIGLIVDRAAAEAAHRAGPGATIELALGGHSGIVGDSPLLARFTVERLSDGIVDCVGPFYRGAKLRLGPTACLRIGGVRVVVSCSKTQLADQAMFRFVGIEPKTASILVLKSSVHFRADFTPIAEEIIVAKAPGPMPADPRDVTWRKLPAYLQLSPQ
jgi:microcystin degradation protein MlrC